ncbi:hypothetical protein ACU4GD_02735 [Cupriavidus basilensis]
MAAVATSMPRVSRLAEDKLRQPWWLEYTGKFLPGDCRSVPAALVRDRAVQDPVRLDDSRRC